MKDSQFLMVMAWIAICQCVSHFGTLSLIFLGACGVWYLMMAYIARGGEPK